MASAFNTIISLEPSSKTIRLMSSKGGDKNSLQIFSAKYKAKQFDGDFDSCLIQILQSYVQNNPSFGGKSAGATIIVPDGMVITDSISIPNIKKSQTNKLMEVVYESRYKNYKDLNIKTFVIGSNKQYTSYGVNAINKKFAEGLYSACDASNVIASSLTYAGNAAVNSVLALNPKLRNQSFVLADIRESNTRLCMVIKGFALGSIVLPFGYSVLQSPKLVAENMLFDHPSSELAVLNAIEKAKAKQLTVGGGTGMGDTAEEDDDEENAFSFSSAGNNAAGTPGIKVLPKKVPRVLPKYIQRPDPSTSEEMAYENFRIFEKYILEFIRGNKQLCSLESIENVYVNIPSDFDYLLELSNNNKEENGVVFNSLAINSEPDIVRENLELYGGLFTAQFNQNGNF